MEVTQGRFFGKIDQEEARERLCEKIFNRGVRTNEESNASSSNVVERTVSLGLPTDRMLNGITCYQLEAACPGLSNAPSLRRKLG